MTSKNVTRIIYDIDHTATSMEDLIRLLLAVTRDISRYTGGLTVEQLVEQVSANDSRFKEESKDDMISLYIPAKNETIYFKRGGQE